MAVKINHLSTDVALEKVTQFSILKEVQPISYRFKYVGIDSSLSGKGVKIAVLDTGEPKHKDLSSSEQSISFCDSNKQVVDKIGHSTILSGIISSNSHSSIQGIAPNSTMLYGKVVSNDKKCSFNSIVSGVLWSIVKDVDIIVIALGSQYDYKILYDSLSKARERGICIFAASGMHIDKIDYPANYKEVFSCGFLSRYKIKNDIIKSNVDFYLPYKQLVSTYLDDQYIQIGGSSVATAFFAGLGSLFVEYYKNKGILKEEIPKQVYNDMLKTLR